MLHDYFLLQRERTAEKVVAVKAIPLREVAAAADEASVIARKFAVSDHP